VLIDSPDAPAKTSTRRCRSRQRLEQPVFDELQRINARPALFCVSTADVLWGDRHISERMLAFHLDGDVDTASRTTDFIERSLRWLKTDLGVDAVSRVLDLGCGPGLYSNPLAAAGAHVTGVDLSGRSIRYARDQAERASLDTTYVLGNYLDVPISGTFDVVLMIMCDYCALTATQRRVILDRLCALLARDGRFVFDVYSFAALAEHEETVTYAPDLMDGFWSKEPYFGFHNTFVYGAEHATLDKYEVVERDRTRTIYNWLQYYNAETLTAELAESGFAVERFVGDLTGSAFDPDAAEFGVIARLS